ncbi:hypothetical protein Aduo_003689 [Ancylostoma duodenale]
MRALLLLLLAGGGFFVSAKFDSVKECLTCGIVVSGVAQGGDEPKEEVCRSLQKIHGDLVRLCRSIFDEVKNNDLYGDIQAALKGSDPLSGAAKALNYCRTGFSKKYCSIFSILRSAFRDRWFG